MRTEISLHLLLLITALCTLGGCKKWVTLPPPPDTPSAEVLFATEGSATGVLNGVYSAMIGGGSLFSSSLATLYSGLSADELYYYSAGPLDGFARNELSGVHHSTLSTGFWQPAYRFIYTANLATEKLPAAPLSEAVKKRLLGEARFIRAFCYLYLVNFFGDVPLVRSTDAAAATALPRAPQRAVYEQILEDLRFAEEALPSSGAPEERLRPARQAATALRARVHLYLGQWEAAAAAAGTVIASAGLRLAESPGAVFGTLSPETIFYLEPPPPYFTLPEAAAVLPHTPATLPTYGVRRELLDAFEPGDRRKEAWVGGRSYGGTQLFFPAKYKGAAPPGAGYVVLRLGEQYLIRAEARLHGGDLAGAVADVNVLRRRADLPPIGLDTKEVLLAALERERRVELAFEWGHRWSDLRRTGRANTVLRALKGATWQPTDVLWPLPGDQLLLNRALTQNPGY